MCKKNEKALELAYNASLDSVDSSIRRLDRKDDQLVKVLIAAVALTGVATVQIESWSEFISSYYLGSFALLSILQVVVCAVGRYCYKDRAILGVDHFDRLYGKGYNKTQLMEAALRASVTCYNENDSTVNKKLKCLECMSAFLILQSLCLMAWNVEAGYLC